MTIEQPELEHVWAWGKHDLTLSPHLCGYFQTHFLEWKSRIFIKVPVKFVPRGLINNVPALVQVMSWRRTGDKPLSEPMVVRSPMQLCVTRPQWVKDGYSEIWIRIQFSFGNLGNCQPFCSRLIKAQPTATRLGLCNSLLRPYLTTLRVLQPPGWDGVTVYWGHISPHWESYSHQDGTVYQSTEAISHHTESPTATRLGLCNSLLRPYLTTLRVLQPPGWDCVTVYWGHISPHWESYSHQDGTV